MAVRAPRAPLSRRCPRSLLYLLFRAGDVSSSSSFRRSLLQPAPAVLALVDFLRAHAHDAVLDGAAMARLNGALVPAALAAWPALRQVLETRSQSAAVFAWTTAAHGFTAALTHEEVCALTQLLMLQVGPPVVCS